MIAGLCLAALCALAITALAGARSWVQLLWALAFLPFLSVDPVSGGLVAVEGLGGINVRLKLALRAVTAIGLAVALARRRDAWRALARIENLPFGFFIAWAGIGLLRRSEPLVPALRLAEVASFFVAAQALYLEVDQRAAPRDVARWHLLAPLSLCVTALAYLALDPTIAAHVGPGGMRLGHRLIEANVLGLTAGLGFLWALSVLVERGAACASERRWAWIVGVLALAVLLLARSRTAMISVVIGALVALSPLGDARRWPRFLGGMSLVLLAGCAAQEAVTAWMLRGAEARDFVTGTGRTHLWQALLVESFPRHPWLGAGYLALDHEGAFTHAGTNWTNAHNTYVFALVSLGIPGLLATLALLFLPLSRLLSRVRRARPEERCALRLLLAAQLMIVISSVTSFGIAGPPNAAMLFALGLFPYAMHGGDRCARER